jgi:hypothetical protein
VLVFFGAHFSPVISITCREFIITSAVCGHNPKKTARRYREKNPEYLLTEY